MSSTDLRTRVLRDSQTVVPSRSRVGFTPPKRLIFLDQVEARERNVETGVVRIKQKHEFAGGAVGADLPQAFKLADAVIDVNHVIAGLEIGKIAEETGCLGPGTGSLRRRARESRTNPSCRIERAGRPQTRRLR